MSHDDWLQTLRGAVRPVGTFWFLAVIGVLAALEALSLAKVPEWFITLVGSVVGYWWGTREKKT